jgi:predicted MFS family arabinose efflux permease
MTTIASPARLPPSSRRMLPNGVAFVFVSAALAAFFLAAGAPTPLLPIYQAHWHFAPWMLTWAFGVYALALLAALLIFGSLSDFVGRRRLLISALSLELVSMLVFLEARSIGWVIAGRVVQGIATGAATSTVSAAIVELAPEHRKGLGATISSVTPAAGLGVGAVLAGTVAQFSTAAATTVWTILAAVMALATLLALFVPETTSRRPGALASLAPRAAVPAHVRGDFVVVVPAQIAAWMLAALFFGLVPTILGSVFDRHSPLESGMTAFVVPATFTLSAVFLSKVTPQRPMILGGVGVIAGAALVSTSAALALLPLLWVGGIASGIGFGATLTGTIRPLTPQVDGHERAELFAAIYVVAYLAFGLPAIVAGLFVASVGASAVVVTFGIVTAIAGAVGPGGRVLPAWQWRRSR